MPETYDKPNPQYLQELLGYVQRFWRPQTDFDAERLSLYFDEDAVIQENTYAPQRRRRVRPERMTANELRREVDLITALFPYPAEIGVQHIGEGARRESTAEKIEIGINEAIDVLNPPLDAPILRERWQMSLLGRAARLICPGHAYWWDFPNPDDYDSLDDWAKGHEAWARQAPIPVCWVDLPAESTFPASFGRIDEELISWQKVTGYDLAAMFSQTELAGTLFPNINHYGREFTLVIYANRQWLCYAVTGGSADGGKVTRIIRPIEHGLGVPAIQITPGATSGKKEPGKFWQGVSDSSMALIRAANKRLSEAATASKFDSLPIFKMWLQDNLMVGEGAQSDNMELPHGDLLQLRTENAAEGAGRENIEPLFMPQFGEKTLALAQFALTRAERNSGAVEALEGAAGPSGEPAWSRNSIIEQSKMKHSRLSQAVAAADLAAAEMISRSIQTFKEDVYITPQRSKGPTIVLRPKDLGDYALVLKSEYKMKLPVSRRADIQLMVSVMEQAKRADLPLSPAWVMENIGDITRPMEEFKRSVMWDLLTSEESKQFYRALLRKEAEFDLSEDEAVGIAEIQAMVQSGQLPPQLGTQLAQLATGGGPALIGNRGQGRAGIPFSTSPTGPKPNEELPPVGAY